MQKIYPNPCAFLFQLLRILENEEKFVSPFLHKCFGSFFICTLSFLQKLRVQMKKLPKYYALMYSTSQYSLLRYFHPLYLHGSPRRDD